MLSSAYAIVPKQFGRSGDWVDVWFMQPNATKTLRNSKYYAYVYFGGTSINPARDLNPSRIDCLWNFFNGEEDKECNFRHVEPPTTSRQLGRNPNPLQRLAVVFTNHILRKSMPLEREISLCITWKSSPSRHGRVRDTDCSSQPLQVINSPPFAFFANTSCTAGTPCVFNASGSLDRDGVITGYQWSFGDGTTGSGKMPNHTYDDGFGNSTVNVTLAVTDDAGDSASFTREVLVMIAPGPGIITGLVNLTRSDTFNCNGYAIRADAIVLNYFGGIPFPTAFISVIRGVTERFTLLSGATASAFYGAVNITATNINVPAGKVTLAYSCAFGPNLPPVVSISVPPCRVGEPCRFFFQVNDTGGGFVASKRFSCTLNGVPCVGVNGSILVDYFLNAISEYYEVTPAQTGQLSVSVTPVDNHGASSTAFASTTVGTANSAPIIMRASEQYCRVGNICFFTIFSGDADTSGPPASIDISCDLNGVSCFSSAQRLNNVRAFLLPGILVERSVLFFFVPTTTAPGTMIVTVTAADSLGASSSTSEVAIVVR